MSVWMKHWTYSSHYSHSCHLSLEPHLDRQIYSDDIWTYFMSINLIICGQGQCRQSVRGVAQSVYFSTKNQQSQAISNNINIYTKMQLSGPFLVSCALVHALNALPFLKPPDYYIDKNESSVEESNPSFQDYDRHPQTLESDFEDDLDKDEFEEERIPTFQSWGFKSLRKIAHAVKKNVVGAVKGQINSAKALGKSAASLAKGTAKGAADVGKHLAKGDVKGISELHSRAKRDSAARLISNFNPLYFCEKVRSELNYYQAYIFNYDHTLYSITNNQARAKRLQRQRQRMRKPLAA